MSVYLLDTDIWSLANENHFQIRTRIATHALNDRHFAIVIKALQRREIRMQAEIAVNLQHGLRIVPDL